MTRYKITIEYDGSGTLGWQKQSAPGSIQQYIEEAIEKFSGEKPFVCAAGRTDAGVHALAQVAHFDLVKFYQPKEVLGAINYFLKPNKIIIISCDVVDEKFHARFSAKKRNYRYIILNRLVQSVLDSNRCWHIKTNLNIVHMQNAANLLIGTHNFTSFRAIYCQALSPIKTIDEIRIEKLEEKIILSLRATSFLHHMVRNIVGTLAAVGLGKFTVEDVSRILKAEDRTQAGQTAPACGLYFSRVEYD